MSTPFLLDLAARRKSGGMAGITSVCSAHPLVIEAALLQARADDQPALIEATCNQVNHHGGYTGMTPADFRRFVEAIAARVGFDTAKLILGGDHLGPNPWKHLPADEAMSEAASMVKAYVEAGFSKIHLDTSMGSRNEPIALADEVTAVRAARLARVAEAAVPADRLEKPVYVIGTEVPTPGGALEALDHIAVTTPGAVRDTVEIHRRAFNALGLDAAFDRAVAVVVQPGVEFGNDSVTVYDPVAARPLSAALGGLQQFVYEAHSTDYQPERALAELVRDGFAILKVGPGLTLALREALYGLDHIAAELDGDRSGPSLQAAMEEIMLTEPRHWRAYYHGGERDLYLQRHFSYSDRIRYYWPAAEARAAVERLLARLAGRHLPATLVSQYLGALGPAVAAGEVRPEANELLLAAVRFVLAGYSRACRAS